MLSKGTFHPLEKNLCYCVTPSDLGLPHQPELKDVHMSSTLNGLVAGVVRDVVLFVWLEQVAGTHGVTARQDSLQIKKTNAS